MNVCENEAVIAFDTLYTQNHIQILKILLPYFDPYGQNHLAVWIKYLELRYTLEYVSRHPSPPYKNQTSGTSSPDFAVLFEQIKNFCSPQEKALFGELLNLQKNLEMFEEMKEEVHDWKDDEEISRYLARLLNKDAFDHAGLIYGVGHAVYSKSDPRAVIFKGFVERLSEEKGLHDEFELYNSVERLAPAVIAKERQMYKGVSINVDFYSGFVYKMLGLPEELYTPIFAMARIVGWSAHRMEELANNGKIIRPAYKPIHDDMPYIPLADRP